MLAERGPRLRFLTIPEFWWLERPGIMSRGNRTVIYSFKGKIASDLKVAREVSA